MAGKQFIIKIYFNSGEYGHKLNEIIDYAPLAKSKDLFGKKYWLQNGEPVYRWSRDMVTCTDERWIFFGPFVDKKSAKDVFDYFSLISPDHLNGYRIMTEHCVVWSFRDKKYPREYWTDG